MAQIKGSITVFPARAGVIPIAMHKQNTALRLSRTSGGDPHETTSIPARRKSFPHERG